MALDAAEQFEYASLKTTVRLLRIRQGETPEDLVGELETFSLDSPNCPDFSTVSYVWGDPPNYSKHVLLNGRRLAVLENAWTFLNFICSSQDFSPEQWWWIDSLSINQRDVKERNSQIQIIGRIYTQASKTIVWLGEASDDSDDAIDFLWFLQKRRWEHDEDGVIDRKKFRALRGPEFQTQWKAVQNLLLRPWWSRVWTLQEYIMAPHLELYCGRKHIRRSAFSSAMYATWLAGGADGKLISKKAFDAGWNRRRMLMWYDETKQIPLVAGIAYAGASRATDEKDRMYSLLGLAGRSDRMLIGTPDYSSTTSDVFTSLVKSFVVVYRSLDIICFAHDHRRSESESDIKLPSWVPDWTVDVEAKVVPLMASQAKGHIGNFRPVGDMASTAIYAASGIREPVVNFSSDSKTLTCQGVLVDYIDGLGSGCSEPCIRSMSDINTNTEEQLFDSFATSTFNDTSSDEPVMVSKKNPHHNNVLELVTSIARSLVLDRTDKYLNHAIDPKKTSAEFQALCHAALTQPETVHESFLRWFRQNKSLRMRGWTLEDLFRSAPTLTPPETVDFRNASERESLPKRIRDTVVSLERRLTVTQCGYIGMAPDRARRGDIVCVLLGCNIPVVLRKRAKEESYEFIGECYLDGFMNGEVIAEMDEGRRKSQSFDLT